MPLDNLSQQLTAHLEIHAKHCFPKHWFKDVYEYSLLPAGKMFRPSLVACLAEDFGVDALKGPWTPHSLLASAIEIHHTYTLIHDDLPSMDDDDMRRGRPTSHKKFGEWQAVLAGDGLLIVSFQLLSKINSSHLSELLKFFSWCVGPKGLIQGQVLDLSEEMTNSFENLRLTHQLKTARLIQASLVGSYLLIEDQKNRWQKSKDLFRLGHSLGLLFQFLDDLSELAEDDPGKHELSVNPWIHENEAASRQVKQSMEQLSYCLDKYHLENTMNAINVYFSKMNKIISGNESTILGHTNSNFELKPVVNFLNGFSS